MRPFKCYLCHNLFSPRKAFQNHTTVAHKFKFYKWGIIFGKKSILEKHIRALHDWRTPSQLPNLVLDPSCFIPTLSTSFLMGGSPFSQGEVSKDKIQKNL